MSGTLTNIVLVQYFPGTEEYIVYREGTEPELYRGGAAITDQDFYIYAQECAASGCVFETMFHVATGLVEGKKFVTCKQLVYSKALAQGASANAVLTGAKGMAASVLNSVVNTVGGTQSSKRDAHVSSSNISWVKWSPALYELSVCAGKLPIPKVHRIHTLQEAPEEILNYMRWCFSKKFIALRRSYRRPLQEGRQARIAEVIEYYFSVSKPNKDFQGNTVQSVTREDMSDMGLIKSST